MIWQITSLTSIISPSVYSSGVKEELEADIEEVEQRREEIMRSSLHEDQFPEDEISDLAEEVLEESVPVEQEQVKLEFKIGKKIFE